MKPLSSHSIAELAALGTVPILGIFLIWALWPVHGAIKTNSAGSAAVLAKAGTALDTINRPKSGTLSMIDDTILQGRLTIDATNQVLIHEQNQLTTFDADLANVTGGVDTALASLTGTTDAATESLHTLSKGVSGTLSTANVTLGTLNAAIATIPPLTGRATLFLGDADAILRPIPAIEANIQVDTKLFETTIGTTNHMLFTGDQVETKLAKCTLHTTFACVFKSDVLFGAQVGGYLLR